MKIKTIKHTREEIEIDLPITVKQGSRHLFFKKSGGYLAYFKVKVINNTLEYVYCEPRSTRLKKVKTSLELLFASTEHFNVVIGKTSAHQSYVQFIKGYDYEEIEMLNYILSLDSEGVAEITLESYNEEINKIINL